MAPRRYSISFLATTDPTQSLSSGSAKTKKVRQDQDEDEERQISTSLHIQMQSIRFILVSFGLAPAASMNYIHAEQ